MSLAAIPNRPVDGSPEDISRIIADFDAILAVMNGLLDDDNVANSGLSLSKLKASAALVGQVPVWSGSTWAPGQIYPILGMTRYAPAAETTLSTNITTFADVDATNIKVTVKAPPSGKVLVSARFRVSTSTQICFNLRESTNNITGSETTNSTTSPSGPQSLLLYASALTPNTTYDLKLGWRMYSAGTGTMILGDASASGDSPPLFLVASPIA
jgi:hypothetical protein